MTWRKAFAIAGHSAPVYACVVDQQFIYSTAGDRYVVRWNQSTGEQDRFTVKLDAPAYSMCLSTKNELLLVGCTNGAIVALNLSSNSLEWEHNFLGKAIFSIADYPTESWFIIGDAEGHLLVIDYSGKLLTTFHLDCGKIRTIKRYEDRLLLACQDGTWRQLELPTFNEVTTQQAHEGGVTALCKLSNEQILVTGGKDAHLRLWDLITGQLIQAWPAHYQTIYGIEQVGNEMISVSMDKTIKVWNSETWQVTQRIEGKQGGHHRSVNGCLGLNPLAFLTFSDDKTIIKWHKS